MDIATVASFLSHYIKEVPDESLLKYLVATFQSDEPSQEEKDDLLYSLLPELGLLDDFAKSTVSQALGGNSQAGNVFGFSNTDAEKTNQSSQPRPQPQPQQQPQPQPHEFDLIREEVQDFLEALDLGEVALTVESEIIGYLISAFQDTSLDAEERKVLIQSYIFQQSESKGESDLVAVSDDILGSISSFLEAKAEEQKEEEEAKMAAVSQGRAADIQSSLQSIVSEQRREKSVISQEEAIERAKLVKVLGNEEVLPKYDEKGKETKPISSRSPILFVANPKKESKIRYRDGQVVSKSGGKYIIEKVEEEYDSGARGRVKSKGKRGAGAGKGL